MPKNKVKRPPDSPDFDRLNTDQSQKPAEHCPSAPVKQPYLTAGNCGWPEKKLWRGQKSVVDADTKVGPAFFTEREM